MGIRETSRGQLNSEDLKVQFQEFSNRVATARELLLCGDIEADDYRAIRSEREEEIDRLKVKFMADVNLRTTVEPSCNKALTKSHSLMHRIDKVL